MKIFVLITNDFVQTTFIYVYAGATFDFLFLFPFCFFYVTKKKTTKSPVTKRHFGRVLNISFERIGEGYCIWMWVTKALEYFNF